MMWKEKASHIFVCDNVSLFPMTEIDTMNMSMDIKWKWEIQKWTQSVILARYPSTISFMEYFSRKKMLSIEIGERLCTKQNDSLIK